MSTADGTQTFTLVVRVNLQTPSGASISNVATVSSNPVDAGPGANQASLTTPVTFASSRPATVHASVNWALHDSLAAAGAGADVVFTLGTRPLSPLTGDWDGNGSRTAGYYKSGTFFLTNGLGPSPTVDLQFAFGDARGFPVAGDFNGDGVDDVAVYREGQWQVRLSNGTVLPTFAFGPGGSWPNTVPVAGDWNGDGTDGIGTYSYATGTWTLRQTASGGTADIAPFVYWSGPATASYPVVGDWNGDGIDSIGVRSAGAAWSLNDQKDSGPAEYSFVYGDPNALPLSWRRAGPA